MSQGHRGSLSSSISATSLSGSGGQFLQAQRLSSSSRSQHTPALGGSSSSLLRARPSSANAARAAQETSAAERSVGLASDPKLKVLQAFAGKRNEENVTSAREVDAGIGDCGSLCGSSEPELEAEEVQPALLQNTSSSLPGHLAASGSRHGSFSAGKDWAAGGSRHGSFSAGPNGQHSQTLSQTAPAHMISGMTTNSAGVSSPISQKAHRPKSASSTLGRERRQRPGLARMQRQRTSGCDRIDHKIRDIAKEAKAQHARIAQSKHFRPAQSEESRAAELKDALGNMSKFNITTRLVSSASSLPRPKSAGAYCQVQSTPTNDWKDGHSVRQQFHEQSERTLRRLLVDLDLAADSGLPRDSHEARCVTVDRVFDWYERHASAAKATSREPKTAGQPGIGPAWLVVRAGEPPPPGSLRTCYRQPSPLLSLQLGSSCRAESLASSGKSLSTPTLGLAN
eukprot:TRINITY_DN9363_c1_g1_i1.p1 TRINITY_DN9363_c1_g1~~TRINITY_DN9363_c1_g1_i1.p1  ORF type:complete len:454 (-),score=56.93 TRINITY_DN9363_c1_g1_i1:195-1556(-)